MPDKKELENFDKLSEDDKIKMAKTAVSDYLKIMEHLTDAEKALLSKALEDIQDDNIEQIKQQIMQID